MRALPEGMSSEKTYEEVVRELAESLSRPSSFTEVQILANLKPGLEVPLMGISTIADSLRGIYQKRREEDAEIKTTILLAAGIGEKGYEGFNLEQAVSKLDARIEEAKLGPNNGNGSDQLGRIEVLERIKIRLKRLNETKTDEERLVILERLESRLLTNQKHMRYSHAINLVQDMVGNFLKYSMALQGESQRSKQVLAAIQAIVLHEKDAMEALMGPKESMRDKIGKRLRIGSKTPN